MSRIVPTLARVEPAHVHKWESFLEHYPGNVDELVKRASQSAFFLYETPTGIIGLTDVVMDEEKLVVRQVLIKERFRGMGHGSSLMQSLEYWSKFKGFKQIIVEPPASKVARFWESYGAEKRGSLR